MNADPIAIALLTLGVIFLAGLAADVIGRRTHLPRVTLLLLLGVCVGPLGFDLFPESSAEWFPFIADLALVVSQRVPEVGGAILTATVAGTIVFEIVGPIHHPSGTGAI
jgi:hypothetical protein